MIEHYVRTPRISTLGLPFLFYGIKGKKAKKKFIILPLSRFSCSFKEFWIDYMDDIASQIGVKPDLYKLFKEDPVLSMRCLFGSCLPAQYRLQGPGQWTGAKETINGAMNRCLSPMKTRIQPKNFITKKKHEWIISFPAYLKSYFIIFFIFFFFFCMCLF